MQEKSIRQRLSLAFGFGAAATAMWMVGCDTDMESEPESQDMTQREQSLAELEHHKDDADSQTSPEASLVQSSSADDETLAASCDDPTEVDSDHSITIHRVQRRLCGWEGWRYVCRWNPSSNYVNDWQAAGVDLDKQKDIYIGALTQPEKEDVRNVVFMTTGQIGVGNLVLKNKFNVHTGQQAGWRDSFSGNKSHAKESLTIDKNSTMARLLDEEIFDPSDSLITAAFGNAYIWGDSESHRTKMIDAYSSWLAKQTDPDKVETVFLAGSSRGGCLVTTLAKDLLQTFKNAKIIVHSFDGICNHRDEEIEVSGDEYDNPVSDDRHWKGHLLDLRELYGDELERIIFRSTIGGDPVAIWDFAGRAFVQTDTEGDESTEAGWLSQEWTDLPHKCHGNQHEMADRSIEHLTDTLNRIEKAEYQLRIRSLSTGKCFKPLSLLDSPVAVGLEDCSENLFNGYSFEFAQMNTVPTTTFGLKFTNWGTDKCLSRIPFWGASFFVHDECTSTMDQVFTLEQGNGGSKIKLANTNLCLDADNPYASQVVFSTCSNATSQLFEFEQL